MQHSTKSTIYLMIFSLSLVLLGHGLGQRQGLLLGFLIAVATNTLVYLYGTERVLNLFHIRRLRGQDPWQLQDQLQALCKKLSLPNPKLYIASSNCPTALVAGNSQKNAKIILTEGLIHRLTHRERESVLALAVAKIYLHEPFSFMVGGTFCAAVMSLAISLDRILQTAFGWMTRQKQIKIFQVILSPLASLLLHSIVFSSDYLRSDQQAAEIIGDSTRIAEVLWKMNSYALNIPLKTPVDTAHLFFVNPLAHQGMNRYFLTQPKVNERIKNLLGHFPI